MNEVRYREKDPDSFDPTLRALIDQSLKEEIIIPCENEVKARRIRSQIYSLRRAWKERAHENHTKFLHIRSRVHSSHDVMRSRPTVFIDEDMPYCLVIDSRNANHFNLNNALAYRGPARIIHAGPRGVKIIHGADTDAIVVPAEHEAPTEQERIQALSSLLQSLDEEEDETFTDIETAQRED